MSHAAFTLPWLQHEERAWAVIGAEGRIAARIARDLASVQAPPVPQADQDKQGTCVDPAAGHARHHPDRCDMLADPATALRGR